MSIDVVRAMNCIVIDDDLVQQHLISEFINKTEGVNLIHVYSNVSEVIGELDDIDLLFLDVEMPGMSGIEFLEKYNPKSNVILITSKRVYALDGFDNDVVDFLLKPISYQRFLKSINKIEKLKPEIDSMYVKSNGAIVKIKFNEINWIQSASEYVVIHIGSKRYMVYSSMEKILNKLPENFIRVHRSNIVNSSKVDSVKGFVVKIEGQEVKISKTYKQQLMSILKL